MVVSGVAQRDSLKAEDVWAIRCDDSSCRVHFGVFDSHGGKEAGKKAAETLSNNLISLNGATVGHDAFPMTAVHDQFWDLDRSLGEQGIMSGTTASVLLVSTKAQEGSNTERSRNGTATPALPTLCCTLLWVGDSTALCVDMTSGRPAPIVRSSTDHVPTNPKEEERCSVEWQVRRLIRAAANSKLAEADSAHDSFVILRDNGESFYARHKAPTAGEVAAVVKEAGLKMTDGEVALLVRALGREKRLEAPERRKSFSEGSGGVLLRADSFVMKRASPENSTHGPTVLGAGEHNQVTTCGTEWDWNAHLW